MIAYLDSSVIARAYLTDEPGFDDVRRLLADDGIVRVTGTLTPIEVSAAIVRAARARRVTSEADALTRLDADLADDGCVAVIAEPRERIEEIALQLVRAHGMRTLGAWHLAVASLALPAIAEPGEEHAFATRDGEQAAAAARLGFVAL